MVKLPLFVCILLFATGCILIDESAKPQGSHSVRKKHTEKLHEVSGSEKAPAIDSTSMSQKTGDITPKPYVEKIDPELMEN